MPQEPKSLLSASSSQVTNNLLKAIDEKTDTLLPLRALLQLLETNQSDLGEKFLEALSILNEELRLNRELRHQQEEALKASTAQQEILAKQLDEIKVNQDKLLAIMNIPTE